MTKPVRRASFLDPARHPVPRGEKLILYTKFGTCIVGQWSDEDCIGWYPLLDVPAKLKVQKQKFPLRSLGDD